MADLEQFRRRMIAAGVDLPAELLDTVATLAGPLALAHELLLSLDLDDVEPFSPSRRLPDDAAS
jgi:hypothetical protein